jgi:hypothetical protein
MAHAAAAGTDWRERWNNQKHTWNVDELAKLCCDWDPSDGAIPDRCRYNDAIVAITRSVRSKILLPLDLQWPATGAERLYGEDALFSPAVASAWAVKEFPDTFALREMVARASQQSAPAPTIPERELPPKPAGPAPDPSLALTDQRRMLVTKALRRMGVTREEFLRTNEISTDVLRGVINGDGRRVNLLRWTPKILSLLDITTDDWNPA